ncbi:MAG TPA: serine/threonine-protein kinase, partial [Gemmatimonadaceae bacterium]|nr:serine/threonine-protein kinase [Gemmatimonadaceae bacterium]
MPDALREALQSLLGSSFELRRELGGGGMSRVFVAHEPALKRDVVVKVLPTDLFSTKSADRFQREVETTARLQHPHILPVVTAGGSARLRYYVVPYIAGGSLRDRLDSGDRLSFEAATTLIGELLAAVAFAHERGIVHRDIKPANVLIAEGHAVLADFGIAQAVAAAQAADGLADSSVAPPEAYLAPERPTDTSADLFAVAALAHEILTGALAAAGVSAADVFAALRQSHPTANVQRLRSVAEALARALAVAPATRFASASALRSALRIDFTTSSSRR